MFNNRRNVSRLASMFKTQYQASYLLNRTKATQTKTRFKTLYSTLSDSNTNTQHNVYLRLILVGPPGCGKGTISKKLNKQFNLHTICTGDLIRNFINDVDEKNLSSSPNEINLVKQLVQQGRLIPSELSVKLTLNQIINIGFKNCVLDGFPRNVEQAQILDSFLIENDKQTDKTMINYAFYIDVPSETIISRIKERWIHLPSNRTYNMEYNPPKKPGIDDITGEPLTRRTDDDINTVKQRLKIFQEYSKPVIEYYKAQNKLLHIKGTQSRIIYEQIKHLIEDKLRLNTNNFNNADFKTTIGSKARIDDIISSENATNKTLNLDVVEKI